MARLEEVMKLMLDCESDDESDDGEFLGFSDVERAEDSSDEDSSSEISDVSDVSDVSSSSDEELAAVDTNKFAGIRHKYYDLELN